MTQYNFPTAEEALESIPAQIARGLAIIDQNKSQWQQYVVASAKSNLCRGTNIDLELDAMEAINQGDYDKAYKILVGSNYIRSLASVCKFSSKGEEFRVYAERQELFQRLETAKSGNLTPAERITLEYTPRIIEEGLSYINQNQDTWYRYVINNALNLFKDCNILNLLKIMKAIKANDYEGAYQALVEGDKTGKSWIETFGTIDTFMTECRAFRDFVYDKEEELYSN